MRTKLLLSVGTGNRVSQRQRLFDEPFGLRLEPLEQGDPQQNYEGYGLNSSSDRAESAESAFA